MIKIDIYDDGEHWHKTVKMFGLTVYHRHDFTKEYKQRPIGFNTFTQIPSEVDDEDWDDEE